MIVDLLVTAVYIAVTNFYKYFGVIPTYQALKQVGQVSEVKGSDFSLMHASFLFLFTDIVLFLIAILTSHSFRKWGKARSVRERGVFVSIVFILSFSLSFVGIWFNKNIINELKQAEVMDILNYQVYAAVASAQDVSVDPKVVTQESIDQLKHVQTARLAAPQYWGQAKGKNVIIIQMEAFQNFLINMKLDGQEVTPNLNKLVRATSKHA
ncbi:hypothetical protein [Paenibacillus sp. MMO-177]|uniref:hypothetical protein n=1 Tax=Paenibacillus sp. MMO-177 TaxID=3081289 RepID=UPI0030181144